MSDRQDMKNSDSCSRKNVVITGFGVFREHKANASWEAIKGDRLKIDRPHINVIKKQVDVVYDEVDKVVKSLWDSYKPILMIHIGLAAHEKAIRVEETARLGPYIHDDIRNEAPHKDLRLYNSEFEGCLEENIIRHGYSCKPCSFESKDTCFDVDNLCKMMNEARERNKKILEFRKSRDAGLYVCEYIYKTSLSICDRCIFLHVPDTKDFELEDITTSLKCAIEILVDQMAPNKLGTFV